MAVCYSLFYCPILLVTQSCPTLCDPTNFSLPYQRTSNYLVLGGKRREGSEEEELWATVSMRRDPGEGMGAGGNDTRG